MKVEQAAQRRERPNLPPWSTLEKRGLAVKTSFHTQLFTLGPISWESSNKHEEHKENHFWLLPSPRSSYWLPKSHRQRFRVDSRSTTPTPQSWEFRSSARGKRSFFDGGLRSSPLLWQDHSMLPILQGLKTNPLRHSHLCFYEPHGCLFYCILLTRLRTRTFGIIFTRPVWLISAPWGPTLGGVLASGVWRAPMKPAKLVFQMWLRCTDRVSTSCSFHPLPSIVPQLPQCPGLSLSQASFVDWVSLGEDLHHHEHGCNDRPERKIMPISITWSVQNLWRLWLTAYGLLFLLISCTSFIMKLIADWCANAPLSIACCEVWHLLAMPTLIEIAHLCLVNPCGDPEVSISMSKPRQINNRFLTVSNFLLDWGKERQGKCTANASAAAYRGCYEQFSPSLHFPCRKALPLRRDTKRKSPDRKDMKRQGWNSKYLLFSALAQKWH